MSRHPRACVSMSCDQSWALLTSCRTGLAVPHAVEASSVVQLMRIPERRRRRAMTRREQRPPQIVRGCDRLSLSSPCQIRQVREAHFGAKYGLPVSRNVKAFGRDPRRFFSATLHQRVQKQNHPFTKPPQLSPSALPSAYIFCARQIHSTITLPSSSRTAPAPPSPSQREYRP